MCLFFFLYILRTHPGLPDDTLQLRGGGGGLAASIDAGAAKGKGAGVPKRGLPGLWQRYLDYLERRPLLTKAISAGVIDGTANIIEQTLSPHPFVREWLILWPQTRVVFISF